MHLQILFSRVETAPNIIFGFVLSALFALACIICVRKNIKKVIPKLFIGFLALMVIVFMTFGLRFSVVYYILYLFLAILLGNIFTNIVLKIKENNLFYLCVDFLLGFYGLGLIYFIVSHKFLLNIFGSNFNTYFMVFAYALILIYYGRHYKKHTKNLKQAINTVVSDNSSIILIVITLVVAYLIVFNFNNVITWSWVSDKTNHLKIDFIQDFIRFKSFPFDKVYPFGFQEALYVPTLINQDHLYSMVNAYVFFGFFNLLCIFVIPFEFAKKLNGRRFTCYLASGLTVFFGAIGAPFTNAYLGFINISPSFYHNTTEFFALPPAMLFIYFSYVWYEKQDYKSAYFIIAIIFLNLSFITKPSAYMICAPILCLIILIMLILKKIKILSGLLYYFLTFLPLAYWFIYPKILKITNATSAPPQISSFAAIYKIYFLQHYQNYIFNNIYLTAVIVFTLSLAGLILPMVASRSSNIHVKKFFYVFLFPIFVICVLVACKVVEGDNRIGDGNYMWQITLIGVSLMPFIAKFCEDIKNKAIRYPAYTLLFLHMLSGFWHLLLLNIYKVL